MITKVNQSTIMRRNFHSPAHYFCYHYYLATIVNTAEDANQERERNYYRTVDQKRLRKVAFSISLLYGTDALYFFFPWNKYDLFSLGHCCSFVPT